MTTTTHYKPSPLKAVIAIPPLEDFYATPHRMSALGVKTVEKLLYEAGCEVVTINGVGSCSNRQQISLPAALSYLKPHLIAGETGKCSFFSRYYHFGDTIEELATCISSKSPQICFIACFAFCYSDMAIALAAAVKQKQPDQIIVAGGAGVSVYPEYFLRNRGIDYTLSGEAEGNIGAFITYCQSTAMNPENVPGLGFKNGDQLCFSAAAASSRAATLIPVITRTSDTSHGVSYTASLSRGCNSNCRFCANHLVHGRSFRHTPFENIAPLLSSLLPLPQGKRVSINFEDDNLLTDLSFFRKVICQCRETFPESSFTAENGLDYRLLTPALCIELINCGFSQFNFTLGSVSPSLLRTESRTGSLDQFTNLVTLCNSHNIRVISYLICGFPNETIESLSTTFRFLMQLKTTIGISLFYPVPGLPGFTDKSIFDTVPSVRTCGSSAYPWGASLSTNTLITAFRLARIINCMQAPHQSTEERECITKTITRGKLHTIIKEKRTRRVIEVPHQDVELVQMVMNEQVSPHPLPLSTRREQTQGLNR